MRLKLGGSRFAGLTKAARAISAEAEAELDDGVIVIAGSADEGGTPPAPPAPGDDDEGDGEPKPDDQQPQPEGDAAADPKPAAAATDPTPDANAAERARVTEVFASEHSQGRERQAADMLQTSMSASEIIGLLEKSPKGEAANPMLGALASGQNPDLGAGNAAEPTAKAESKASWDRTLDRLGWNKNPAKAG